MANNAANHLATEQSPYLLQHAQNPVEWYPWGEKAFARAREEDKPIFLSIGYSTCHWCHVMEHESFENEEIASVLREHFVSIKVDREERPDIDRIYMGFVQASTGQGGWPMSVWLTPDLKPFAGGTYFPPTDAYGRPGFKTVLLRIAEAWKKERGKIIRHGEQVVDSLAGATAGGGSRQLPVPSECLEAGYEYFRNRFDSREGGFGQAPKFPRPAVFEFLFHFSFQDARQAETNAGEPSGGTRSEQAQSMALFTLQKMATGGMWDHLGGGFHRYSVDAEWHVPHFEKMLYDQAQLARSYLTAYQLTGEELYAEVAREIFDYVERDLTSPQGGFYSAEDADSYPREGAPRKLEGAYYVWTWEELQALLTAEEFEVFSTVYDLHKEGNVAPHSDPHGELTGQNVLIRRKEPGEGNARAILASARRKCLQCRAGRPRPHLDDKIITAWNGIMVSAYSLGYQVLGEERYLELARQSVAFIHRELADLEEGRLERSFRQQSSGIHGFAEDYAQWIQGLLDLYEACGEIGFLKQSLRFQERMIEVLEDEAGGFFSGVGAEDVIVRMKDDHDGAEPSANSVAALNLARLADMLQRQDLLEKSERVIKAFASTLERFPAALPLMLRNLAWHEKKPRQIVLAGGEVGALRKAIFRSYYPTRVVLYADGGEGQEWLTANGVPISEMKPVEGKPAAYICEDFACRAPVTDPGQLESRQVKADR